MNSKIKIIEKTDGRTP